MDKEGRKNLLVTRTDAELIKDWQEIDKLTVTEHIATVRGWLMDEIQRRFPKEFNDWVENSHIDDRLETYIKL